MFVFFVFFCFVALRPKSTYLGFSVAKAAVGSKAVVLLLIYCLLLLPLFVEVLCFGHCFVIQYFVSF